MSEREMTLQEWVERLPEIHTARREYNALRSQLAVAKARTANVEVLYILACNDRDALRQRLANTELELTHATKTCAEQQWRAEQAQARLAEAEALFKAICEEDDYDCEGFGLLSEDLRLKINAFRASDSAAAEPPDTVDLHCDACGAFICRGVPFAGDCLCDKCWKGPPSDSASHRENER